MKCISFATLSLISILQLTAQVTTLTPVEWGTWENNEFTRQEAKTLVYVYTEWCTLCKKLEREAFSDSITQTLIHENFTLVALNAETKAELFFKGNQYQYVRQGNLGYHELVAQLLDGRLAYPSLVFLDEQRQVIQVIHGYQGLAHFGTLLNYYGLDYYKNTPWTSFLRQFEARQITDD